MTDLAALITEAEQYGVNASTLSGMVERVYSSPLTRYGQEQAVKELVSSLLALVVKQGEMLRLAAQDANFDLGVSEFLADLARRAEEER